ncbi:MAG: hypothetical protein ACO1RX_07745 [Candidatus Sericytochromatia bacterium]
MDLHALNQANRSEHLHARHEKAEQLYRLGCEYLQRAQQHELDRVLLRNAGRCFAAAIEHNRREPRAYVQQAYLMLLVGNQRKALRYVQEALRVAPDFPRAQALLKHIQQRAGKVPVASRPGTAPLGQPVRQGPDLDSLRQRHDKLRIELEGLLSHAYRELQDLKPTWAKPVLDGYRRLQENYTQAYDRLCTQLDGLESHLDVSTADAELQKLEISLNRLDDVCALSAQLVDLYQRVDHLRKLLEKQCETCERQPLARKQIPQLLDRWQPVCDEIADEMDMLEGSGTSLAVLMPAYESLCATFARLDELGAKA